MKIKIIIIVIALLIVGCTNGGEIKTNDQQPTPISHSDEKLTEIPAYELDYISKLNLPEKIDLNADPLNLVDRYIYDYQIILHENNQQLLENKFEKFQLDRVEITDNNDSALLTSTSETASIKLSKMLEEFSADSEISNQAIMLRVNGISFENIAFVLSKHSDEALTFYDGHFPVWGRGTNGWLLLNRNEANFKRKDNQWCYIFMTTDDYSNHRYLIWHENEAENVCCFMYRSILDDRDKNWIEPYLNNGLQFWIEIGEGKSISISDYWIFEYEGLKK